METENDIAESHPDEWIIDMADVMNLTAEQVRNSENKTGKKAAVTIDIVCELYSQPMTPAKVKSTLISIRNLGINRVYLIMCSPSYPLMAGGGIAAVKKGLTASRIEESLDALNGEPDRVYIETCHDLGLEAIAVIKPYEGGGGATIPEGKNVDNAASVYSNVGTLPTVGGERIYFDSFINYHPEMRVKRKSGTGENTKQAITEIKMYYYASTTPSNLTEINAKEENVPTLWISSDNGSYDIYSNISYAYSVVPNYTITDPNGIYVMTKKCVCLTITVKNLSTEYQYVAVTFRDDNFLFEEGYWTRPYSMMKLFGSNGELPTTLGYYVRAPYQTNDTTSNHIWGTEAAPLSGDSLKGIRIGNDGKPIACVKQGRTGGAENFCTWGFEYEYVYTSAVQNGLMSPVIGLAVGKNEYVQGLLCEGYAEVREYWMEQVREALSYGADGIDIRYDGHSAMISDYYYYGYNPPILEAYKTKYGVSLEDEPVNSTTALRIMEIRGDFFLEFLIQASEEAHNAGKIFISHFFATSYDDYGNDGYIPNAASNCFAQWKMPKIIVSDYKKIIDLCDEIVYKDYFGKYFSSADQSCGKQITAYAKSQNKKIWIHCYVQQSAQLNDHFMNAFVASYASGVILYEIVPSFDYQSASDYLKRYVVGDIDWNISILGRISIARGTTAGELIQSLMMIGENVVVNAEGHSVSFDTVLTDDMCLVLNNKNKFSLNLN